MCLKIDFPEKWCKGNWYDSRDDDSIHEFALKVEGPAGYSIAFFSERFDGGRNYSITLYQMEDPIYTFYEEQNLDSDLELSKVLDVAEQINRGLEELKEYQKEIPF